LTTNRPCPLTLVHLRAWTDGPESGTGYADPALIKVVVRDFPDLTVVLTHGGRGWWYDAGAFITLMRPNVWIEISGLPPQRPPYYYKNHDFEKLVRTMIFGTDWPEVPGIEANAVSLMKLGLKRDRRADPAWQRPAGLPTGQGKGNRKRT
jgi:predicted TIM-barrel fold metal-dependent hydrolase